MPAAARAIPVARPSEPRAKALPIGLERACPERRSDHAEVAEWVRQWCIDNRVSVGDLQTLIRVTRSLAARKMAGKGADGTGEDAAPFTLVDVRRIPARFRMSMMLAYLQWCSAQDAAEGLSTHG